MINDISGSHDDRRLGLGRMVCKRKNLMTEKKGNFADDEMIALEGVFEELTGSIGQNLFDVRGHQQKQEFDLMGEDLWKVEGRVRISI
jgi:hypothetical protein